MRTVINRGEKMNDERPDWAQSKEWDGWEPDKNISTVLTRQVPQMLMEIGDIDPVVMFRIWRKTDYVIVPVNSFKSALRIANVIAEELGGWPE